ncbi:Gfo/Idh/MocA family oxidoreductase, partial [Klebsiella pneumoniae]
MADQAQAMAERHAATLGAEKAYGDWRELVHDPQVDVVDITSPNHLHYTMAMAAIAAGKHVYCDASRGAECGRSGAGSPRPLLPPTF